MEEEPDEPSLHFISTQIQSRHEENEKHEKSIAKLTRFKNALEKVVPAQPKVAKKPRKAQTARKGPLASLSAFVRETLGSKKQVDTQNVLDFFTGDEAKINNFLDRLGAKTKIRKHKRAQVENIDVLVDEQEWKKLLDGIQLRFPAFSRKNRKSLRYITGKIEQLQHRERTPTDPGDLPCMWSQASKQLSDDLTAEDVKWLYDLDEEHLDHTTFDTYTQPSQEEPLALTLSQVFDQVLQRDIEVESVVSNSESEPEDDFPGPDDVFGDSDNIRTSVIPSHQHTTIPDSVDVLTSIHFAPSASNSATDTSQSRVGSPVELSGKPSPLKEPTTPVKRKPTPRSTPTKEGWPTNLVITSSPIQDSNNSQEVFLTAPTNSRLPFAEKEPMSHATVVFHGAIRLSPLGSDITMETRAPPPESDVVPDSEDDAELTLIEITKPVPPASESVLQVPSSPGLDLPPVLHPGDDVPDCL